MNPSHFVEKHRGVWESLESFDRRIETDGWKSLEKAEIWRLASLYRQASAHLAIARAKLPGTKIAFYLNALISRTYHRLYQTRYFTADALKTFFLVTYPATMRANAGRFLLSCGIFLATALIGFVTTWEEPSAAGLFLPDRALANVEQGKVWTEGIFNVVPSSVLATQIFCNNISVSFMTFGLGVLAGVGTIYMLVLNGLMLGAVLSFTMQWGVAGKLANFIVGHGFLEITLICAAGAAGFNLARAELFPGSRTRALAFREEGVEGARMILGTVPFMILAGIVEGFYSPDPRTPLPAKLAVGLLLWSGFLVYAFGLRPSPRKKSAPLDELVDSFKESPSA